MVNLRRNQGDGHGVIDQLLPNSWPYHSDATSCLIDMVMYASKDRKTDF